MSFLSRQDLARQLGMASEPEPAPSYEEIDPLAGVLLTDVEKQIWLAERERAELRFFGIRWLVRFISIFTAPPSALVAGAVRLEVTKYEKEHPPKLTRQQQQDNAQIAGLYKYLKPRQNDFYRGVFYD